MQNIDELDKPHGYTERLEVLIDDVDSNFRLGVIGCRGENNFYFYFLSIN